MQFNSKDACNIENSCQQSRRIQTQKQMMLGSVYMAFTKIIQDYKQKDDKGSNIKINVIERHLSFSVAKTRKNKKT